jgi:hypothetical protein
MLVLKWLAIVWAVSFAITYCEARLIAWIDGPEDGWTRGLRRLVFTVGFAAGPFGTLFLTVISFGVIGELCRERCAPRFSRLQGRFDAWVSDDTKSSW